MKTGCWENIVSRIELYPRGGVSAVMTKTTVWSWCGPSGPSVSEDTLERLQGFANKWLHRVGNEEQLAMPFLLELCDALGTKRPYDSSEELSDYSFERPVAIPGTKKRGYIDLYKRDHFVLEAKCGRSSSSEPGSAPVRRTRAYLAYIQSAYNDQARLYALALKQEPPPLLIVVDIGERFWIWPRGIDGGYAPFHSPKRIEIPLAELGDETYAGVIRACFENPSDLDASKFQEQVSREIAEQLAKLATDLEKSHEPNEVARFLMRCLFCMFAEDVDLLPTNHFTKLLLKALRNPAALEHELQLLFEQMNTGGFHDLESIRKFNGALFQNAKALPLTESQIDLLAKAAGFHWGWVEPALFGTLLERALDPRERHRLGAHFTPRTFVERIVHETIERPLRTEWELVQAHAAELREQPKKKPEQCMREAREVVETFRRSLYDLRVLDPACGTGNFLYVSYVTLKNLEHEVLEELRSLGGAQEGTWSLGNSIVPEQFLGLEVKPWAAEIAQLVLWIGHLQWLMQQHGKAAVNEPVIAEQRSVETRDALITWKSTLPRVGSDGKALTRWDGITTREHEVTGKRVPDETAQVEVFDLIDVRRAVWPDADFIVGNPPFIGNKHMREVLGDPYVEAIRGAYDEVPKTVDFVVYWWHRAASLARNGKLRRFGLITTNSLGQTQNRQVLESHLTGQPPVRIIAAIADHPWVADGADVRISMTVTELEKSSALLPARLGHVTDESSNHDHVSVDWSEVPVIHADLTGGANVAAAVPLQANQNISFQGVNLVGKGFRLTDEQVADLGFYVDDLPPVIRPYLNAREFMQVRQNRYVIDAFGWTAEKLRNEYPTAFQWLYDHVKPERDQNRDAKPREYWWLFGRPREKMRPLMQGLHRYIATPETSKHRVFQYMDVSVCPDHTLYAIALEESFFLGVLSSKIHVLWSLAAGGTLESRPRYNNSLCFIPFPFPDANKEQQDQIACCAEKLDSYRKDVQKRHPDVTLTSMYNVLAKYRNGESLTKKEQSVHTKLATGELARIHDELDAAVFVAYGWPIELTDDEILKRLVELNRERAVEESQGQVRWLRKPDDAPIAESGKQTTIPKAAEKVSRLAWPKDPLDQLADILALVQGSASPVGADSIASMFKGARRQRLGELLDRLAERRLLIREDDGRYRAIGQ